MVEITSGVRAAKAALVAHQRGERQALRSALRSFRPAFSADAGQDSLRALIDQDFADRFARILKETPAGQRAAAIARLREIKAASLVNLDKTRLVKPSRQPNPSGPLHALAVKHRAERAALTQKLSAARKGLKTEFGEAASRMMVRQDVALPIAWMRHATQTNPPATARLIHPHS
jgi:hypothetical protein